MPRDIREYLRTTAAVVHDVAPDGTVLYADNRSGTFQLYERSPAGHVRQLTNFAEPVGGRYIPGSRDLIVHMAAGGNERDQLYRFDPATKTVTDLVVQPEYRHLMGGISEDGRYLAYGTNRRNNVDIDIVVRDLTDGSERTVYSGGGECDAGRFSPDDRYLTFSRPGPHPMTYELHLIDLKTGVIREVDPSATAAIRDGACWLADSSAFYSTTNVGRDMMAVSRVDAATGKATVALEFPWDASVRISRDHSTLFVSTNEDGAERCRVYDAVTLHERGELPIGGESVVASLISRDGSEVIYTSESPAHPPDVRRVNLATGASEVIAASRSQVPATELVMPSHHRITSFDGETISALLYRPRRPHSVPTPVVVFMHGGPESQSQVTWNPIIQYLVGHGYAVVAPNVRGSSVYGKRFYSLDDRRLRLDSVRDMGAVHDWLSSQNLDPKRAALYGGSYGGYMVLAGLSMQPDKWAAGVDVVGIANLVTFLENTSAYRRRRREHEYGYLDSDRDFLVEASPMTHIDKIRAPLMIIHGRNDPRVPVGEAEQIHAALRRRGVKSELMIFEDEGHGLAKLANRLQAYPKVAAFLDRVFGQRDLGLSA